ncbi:MAG: sigma-70 region 4 domain-containing protein [Planctomycetaceae bacterium]|nr:sigma-70 region 4 domain-containing protein [Planctomycetaceae bacterium]
MAGHVFDTQDYIHRFGDALKTQVEQVCHRARSRHGALRAAEQTCDLASRVWISFLEAVAKGRVVPESPQHLRQLLKLHAKWAVLYVRRQLRQRRLVDADINAWPLADGQTPVDSGFDWAGFHAAVAALSDQKQLRAVFECMWYDGLSRAETATITGLSVPQVQRRYTEARDQLIGLFPSLLSSV